MAGLSTIASLKYLRGEKFDEDAIHNYVLKIPFWVTQ